MAAVLPLLLLDTPEDLTYSDQIQRDRMLHEIPDDYKSLQVSQTAENTLRCSKSSEYLGEPPRADKCCDASIGFTPLG